MAAKKKPKLSVWKFASCDGCQLSLLDCEDELLAVTGELELAYFVEASGRLLPRLSQLPRPFLPSALLPVAPSRSGISASMNSSSAIGAPSPLRNPFLYIRV